MVDASGNLATQYSYDPFGNTTVSGATNSNEFQYTGRENEGNGLYFYRARYYSPALGRFISEDPLGFAGSDINVYSYVGNNPISRVDPSGLSWICPSFLSWCPDNSASNSAAVNRPLAGRKDRWWSDFFGALATQDWSKGTTGKKLCFLEFARATTDALNPFDFDIENPKDWTELGTKVSSLTLDNIAFMHAANATNVFGFPGLISPYKSGVVQKLTGASEALEAASPFLAIDLAALTKGLPAEWDAAIGGTCDATFF